MKLAKPTWIHLPHSSLYDARNGDILSEGPDPEDDDSQNDSLEETYRIPFSKL